MVRVFEEELLKMPFAYENPTVPYELAASKVL
jgi:hypothetical protein